MKYVFLIASLLVGLVVHAQTPTIHLGRSQARAIWHPAKGVQAPVVILVPGSGPMGPRELIPGTDTVDMKDAALFDQMAAALQSAGCQTLQIGKPGVEDQTKFDLHSLFYDLGLYSGSHWSDFLNNLDDAVHFVGAQPGVDSKRIYILGHSEGTQLAVDYTSKHPNIAGVILLGYAGESLSTIVDWQMFRRVIDDFVATDVDANHDGIVTREEADKYPEFVWPWQEGQKRISYSDIETFLRADPKTQAAFSKMKSSPLYSDGIWNRDPLYEETVSLKQPVYEFTGALDEQTPPDEALKLQAHCKAVGKTNCYVHLVPGVGHGFSPPRPPRAHPYLDMTVGPVEQPFLNELTRLGKSL